MGRNCKESFDFFPLYVDFFENDKIKKLRRAHGALGVLTYLNLLCRIYGGHGYYFVAESVDDLAQNIAEQLLGSRDRPMHVYSQVYATIRYLIEQDILDRGLLEQSVISGKTMQEQYVEMSAKAKRKANIDVYRLVDVNVVAPESGISSEEMPINSEEMPINSEKITQSKVKESKLNNNNTPTPISRARAGGKIDVLPPTLTQVIMFFRDEYSLSKERSIDQADRFISYNDEKGWDCLPNWKEYARRWADRMYGGGGRK
jgi:hypothetical protein